MAVKNIGLWLGGALIAIGIILSYYSFNIADLLGACFFVGRPCYETDAHKILTVCWVGIVALWAGAVVYGAAVLRR